MNGNLFTVVHGLLSGTPSANGILLKSLPSDDDIVDYSNRRAIRRDFDGSERPAFEGVDNG